MGSDINLPIIVHKERKVKMLNDKNSLTTNATYQSDEKLWDELTKLITARMPRQLLPIIEEVFHKKYPKNVSITLLQNEHIIPSVTPEKHMNNILTDITVLVDNKDIYHFECQMNMDNEMVIRLVEYDFHIALTFNQFINEDGTYSVSFPQSVIMYPGTSEKVDNLLTCNVIFPDGSSHKYTVPVVKIQSYSLSDIKEKHLTFFIPFLLLRFRKRLKSKTSPIQPNELTDFTNKLIVILKEEVALGNLTPTQYRDYIKAINLSAERIFKSAVAQEKEVLTVTKSILELPMDEIDELYASIEQRDATIANQAAEITNQATEIANQAAEIARLKKILSDNKISN